MTQADNAQALGMSLDSRPNRVQGQASDMTSVPLPDGWGSFVSEPEVGRAPSHWYAASPYPVARLREAHGRDAGQLSATVSAPSWRALHAAVAEQVALYAWLVSGTRP